MKEAVKEIKRPDTDREQISADQVSGRRLMSKIYEELSNSTVKSTNNPVRKWLDVKTLPRGCRDDK